MAQQDDQPKVVWVLGAGFSAPLGGPTLDDLFTPGRQRDIGPAINAIPNTLDHLYSLFHYGQRFARAPQLQNPPGEHGEMLWRDAEAFLDRLDAAARSPTSDAAKGLIRRYLRQTPQAVLHPDQMSVVLTDLRDAAWRVVSAECSLFLRDADPEEEEKWQAHRRWASLLTGADTVVTFNYDRVIDMLAETNGSGTAPYLSPKGIVGPDSDPDFIRAGELVTVLKLHGSVDWKREPELVRGGYGDFGYTRTNDPAFALRCPADQIMVAAPGPTKRETSRSVLRPLWSRAEQALKAARAVVFVGYRFPETDAEAREVLLNAIMENEVPQIDLHIVLGPERSRDVDRLEHLLRYQCVRAGRVPVSGAGPPTRTFRVVWHPLWAQDFFSVWSRDQLV